MSVDTIAALATPQGPGALAVIRVSGPEAFSILKSIFRPRKERSEFSSHRMYHGDIVCPRTGEYVDEVLVCLMRRPHSYTGEDVLEIFCHGGLNIPQKTLSVVIAAGARPAERGEFTRRAFLNGRLDLVQAEAVGDIVTAGSERGRELALRQLKGELSAIIKDIIARLREILARLEATIDFVEDVDERVVQEGIEGEVNTVLEYIRRLAGTYQKGRLYREGAAMIILGRPNVGKSSLLNCLLGRYRAIVTPVPGTTRDFLEEMVDIEGMLVRIVDTAGIRPTSDVVEREGLKLVWDKLAEADLVLLVLDGSEELTPIDREIIEKVEGKKVISVINKKDLPKVWKEEEIADIVSPPIVHISAKYGDGVDDLKRSIYEVLVGGGVEGPFSMSVMRERHYHCLERAANALEKMKKNLFSHPEIAAEEIREAIRALGAIIGTEDISLEVLDIIFSSFCIGK
ncbi:MAG: tRNA uridine-5-carboxymethylaminomethyl(34) synthesis GTPase MnmE [Syntrophales bacterium]|nr:tRNA uridine-5-carboxymethylaminomethyl(34) synthesis GTPase MnmE [Syntrophales bacterium]